MLSGERGECKAGSKESCSRLTRREVGRHGDAAAALFMLREKDGEAFLLSIMCSGGGILSEAKALTSKSLLSQSGLDEPTEGPKGEFN
ncbi:hypothetical protein E2C01_009498 [Portunus trituberculatus]|uniref:Uncharacterized protein n=1 Tax=Portunus trituberculatus TaxID=210409 RepID=A0A5B7D5Y4_PORTR|nr:hypothetical protein [Portunus trituberculatus]